MIPGIKIGPQSWKQILSDYQTRVCEVWFRLDWLDRYEEMFAYLIREKIEAGLHFWGVLPDRIMPNFAFPEKDIREKSVSLVKNTLDIASKHHFRYVNIHPGSYRLAQIDFDSERMTLLEGRETTESEGRAVLLENISELDEYGKKRGVLFLVETIPSREPMHWKDLVQGRLQTQDMRYVPVAVVEELANRGFFVCNDFCHTAADVISDDRKLLYSELARKTKRLAKQTKLVHVNTLPPPFNGTDGHLGITNEDFAGDVFPTRDQMKSLLSLFADRDDVWVVPEPFSHHAENSQALEELIGEVENK